MRSTRQESRGKKQENNRKLNWKISKGNSAITMEFLNNICICFAAKKTHYLLPSRALSLSLSGFRSLSLSAYQFNMLALFASCLHFVSDGCTREAARDCVIWVNGIRSPLATTCRMQRATSDSADKSACCLRRQCVSVRYKCICICIAVAGGEHNKSSSPSSPFGILRSRLLCACYTTHSRTHTNAHTEPHTTHTLGA